MPIKSKREVACKRCGKTFVIECNDGITVEELKKLNEKVCKKCRIIRMIKCRLN